MRHIEFGRMRVDRSLLRQKFSRCSFLLSALFSSFSTKYGREYKFGCIVEMALEKNTCNILTNCCSKNILLNSYSIWPQAQILCFYPSWSWYTTDIYDIHFNLLHTSSYHSVCEIWYIDRIGCFLSWGNVYAFTYHYSISFIFFNHIPAAKSKQLT